MKSVKETVKYYKALRSMKPHSSVLREVRFQYLEMAKGGDGGELGFIPDGFNRPPVCREYNYPLQPDSFFQEVVKEMEW
tara:strand:+ start:1252 stop:1488 length:237 start_codon:yes stop_codon:yes gene_type:complete